MQRLELHYPHCQKTAFRVLRLNLLNCNLCLLLPISLITDMKMSLFLNSSYLFENCYHVSFHLLFCRQKLSELYIIIHTSRAPLGTLVTFLLSAVTLKPHKAGMEKQTEETGKFHSILEPTVIKEISSSCSYLLQ